MKRRAISKNLLFTQKHFDLILNLNKTTFVDINSLNEIYNVVTETLVDGLEIDRASFWRIESENLVCINLFDKRENNHSYGNNLNVRNLPNYFKALSDGIAIVADNVLTNQYTQELKDNYLIPLGITDMLDLPIREDGKVIGVICCEHRDDPRVWNESDLAFAISVGDILTLMLEKNNKKIVTDKLIENQRKLSLITDNSKDAFVVFESGVVSYISPSYTDYLGFSNEELLNFTPEMIFDRIHPDEREEIRNFVYNKLENKIKNFRCEFRIKTKNDIYIWREDSSSIIYDNNGLYSKYILISRDISEVKKAQEKIERLYSISKIQNLKLLDFTHIISHNIRSSISNMTMILDLIEDTTNEEEKEEYFKFLKESNAKLSDTILHLNNTISIELNTNIRKHKVNLKQETEKAFIAINAIIKIENCSILNLIPNDLEFFTVPPYFESILINLITNAIKYKSLERALVIEIGVKLSNKEIQIYVQDNGLGIDLKLNKNKIFGMYKTFHNNEDAVGLGLFMTKKHVEALGGTIEVESKVNVGSKFKVTFYE